MRTPIAAGLAFALLLPIAAPLRAQAPPMPDLDRQRAEVAKLAWMIGEWSGEGWMQRGPERHEFTVRESIRSELDGLTLLVRGEGRAKTEPERVVHLALGVLAFDEAAGGLRLSSWTAEGRSVVAEVEPTATGLVWSFAAPSGHIRYTVVHDGETWAESGEFSRDGENWVKFHEMTLRRSS
jgi:hypothetical protein